MPVHFDAHDRPEVEANVFDQDATRARLEEYSLPDEWSSRLVSKNSISALSLFSISPNHTLSIILKMIFYSDTLNFFGVGVVEKKYNDFEGRIKDESRDAYTIDLN